MIFVDAGAFVASHRQADAWHKHATAGWNHLERSELRVFTSQLVLVEAVRLIGRYGGITRAVRAGRSILNSHMTILRSDTKSKLAALDLMSKYADQSVSFTDCVSFVLMKQNRLKTVFGFDRHFETAGFELWPSEAGKV